MLGLPKGVVELCPYTSEWQGLFEEEQKLLRDCVGNYVLDIQHIGSTSIPGMIAKPILDIGIAVSNFEEARVCIAPIEQLGYEYRGENGIPRRHYFVKGTPRTHHIHMLEIGSAEWRIHLFFRDYLRQNPEVAAEYADIKKRLAYQFENERKAYTDGKAAFVQRVIQLLDKRK